MNAKQVRKGKIFELKLKDGSEMLAFAEGDMLRIRHSDGLDDWWLVSDDTFESIASEYGQLNHWKETK